MSATKLSNYQPAKTNSPLFLNQMVNGRAVRARRALAHDERSIRCGRLYLQEQSECCTSTRRGVTCFPDGSAYIFLRLAKVRFNYATKLHFTWKFGSFSVAGPARPLKLNGYPSSPLIRNHNAEELPVG